MYAARVLGRRFASSVTTRLNVPKRNVIYSPKRYFTSSSTTEYVKSFWWVTIPTGFIAFTGLLFEIKNYLEVRDFPEIESYLPDDMIQFWKDAYHRLKEAYLWEPYLKAGIAQKGLAQLRDILPFLLEFNYTFTMAARKKTKANNKTRNAEWLRLVNLISMTDKASYTAARVVKTLTRLCEMESVAREIIEAGGVELICKFIDTGRTPVIYYKFLLTLCSHESLYNELIFRPGFVPAIQGLIESKTSQADSVAYGLLRQLIRNVETGGKIYYHDHFEPLRETIEKNKTKSERLRALSKSVNDRLRYLPDLLAKFPTSKCFGSDSLSTTFAHFVLMGLAGAAYCGIRWKAKLPSLSWTYFSRKMAWGFAGATSPFVIRFSSLALYSDKTKNAIENRIYGQNGSLSAAPSVLFIADATRCAVAVTLFFTSWFYGKYLFLPALVGGILQVVEIPSPDDISKGKYLKLKN